MAIENLPKKFHHLFSNNFLFICSPKEKRLVLVLNFWKKFVQPMTKEMGFSHESLFKNVNATNFFFLK
jgi:hypothetical protein